MGILAGIGMRVGFRDVSPIAGIIAAAMSLAGILVGKALFVAHLTGLSLFGDFGLIMSGVGMTIRDPINAIFSLLAIATAYKIGSGFSSDE